MLSDKKKEKEKEKEKKKEKKSSSKHDKDKDKKSGANFALKHSTDDAHPLGINRSTKSLDLLASFPIAPSVNTQIYKTLSRNKHNKYSTLARFTNKSLRELHSDDQFNVTVDNANFPLVQVSVYKDSAEVTREITIPFPLASSSLSPSPSPSPSPSSESTPTTPTSPPPGLSLPTSASTSAVPSSSSSSPFPSSSSTSAVSPPPASYGASGVVVIQGLPPTVDESSIRVKGVLGSATILEVSYNKQINNLPGKLLPHSATDLSGVNTNTQDLEDQLALKKSQLRRIAKEKEFLYKYTQRLSNTTGHGGSMLARGTLEGLCRWTDLHSEMLASLSQREAQASRDLEDLRLRLERAIKERSGLGLNPSSSGGGDSSSPSRNVVVSLFVPKSNQIVLQLTYVTRNASWIPSYDVRVISGSDLLEVTYHAQITQSTGEDWKNVPLTLSTGSAAIGGTAPELKTSIINFVNSKLSTSHEHGAETSLMPPEETVRRLSSEKPTPMVSVASGGQQGLGLQLQGGPQQQGSGANTPTAGAPGSGNNTPSSVDGILPPSLSSTPGLISSSSGLPTPHFGHAQESFSSAHNSVSAHFSIPRVGSIESNGKSHKVTIAILSLLSKFMYFAVPKLSPHAYLKASTTNTTEHPLLPGVAHIFFDTSYITSSEMKTVQPGEDFETYLGIDRAVKIEWKTPQRYTETGGMLAKVQHLTLASQTTIRNTKDKAVTITLSDTLPRPNNDDRIKLRVLDPDLLAPSLSNKHISSVKLNPLTQVLEWVIEVGPSEDIRIPFKYSIEWPKNQEIDIF